MMGKIPSAEETVALHQSVVPEVEIQREEET